MNVDTEPGSQPIVRWSRQVMGMPVSVAIRGRHAGTEAGQAAWQAALAFLEDVDRDYSPWLEDSVVSRLARAEISEGRACELLPTLAEVLEIAEQARVDTDGAFDVRRVFGASRIVRFDPSGVVKGWAAERAASRLLALPDTDISFSVGGDLVCGGREDSPPWRIGIEDPHAPHSTVATVPVWRGAVATSGAAHRGPHLRDARDGSAPSALASVSVIDPSLTTADVDASCAYLLGSEGADWLRARGRTAVLVRADGEVERISPSAGRRPRC